MYSFAGLMKEREMRDSNVIEVGKTDMKCVRRNILPGLKF